MIHISLEKGKLGYPGLIALYRRQGNMFLVRVGEKREIRVSDAQLYLEAGVVVIWVFRFPHLHLHSGFLHELTGSQGHGPQHVLSAALEYFL